MCTWTKDPMEHSTSSSQSRVLCEAPHTRYPTKPWTPRNLRRRYERCSRKQQNSNTSFTRKSSATLSVLFTQPTKQSVVFVMTCRHVGCFRFLETENAKKNEFILIGQKLQLMQHPNCKSSKTLKSNRDIKSSCKNFTSVKEMFHNITTLHKLYKTAWHLLKLKLENVVCQKHWFFTDMQPKPL